jgi:hypothetical protein
MASIGSGWIFAKQDSLFFAQIRLEHLRGLHVWWGRLS